MTTRDLGSLLPGLGEEVVVHTHTHVREDEIQSLWVSLPRGDRELFRILISGEWRRTQARNGHARFDVC